MDLGITVPMCDVTQLIASKARNVVSKESSYGMDMVKNGLGFMHSVSWYCFVAFEITSVSRESELFPAGIGQVQETEFRHMVPAVMSLAN